MGTPGPKPQHDNVRYLRDNPGKRPPRDHVKVDAEAPPCPRWMSPEARKHWRYIIKELKRYHLISTLDQAALVGYCTAYAHFQEAEEKIREITDSDDPDVHGLFLTTPQGYKQVSHWWIVRNKAFEQMLKVGEQFGLTPSARARVNVQNPDQGELDLDA